MTTKTIKPVSEYALIFASRRLAEGHGFCSTIRMTAEYLDQQFKLTLVAAVQIAEEATNAAEKELADANTATQRIVPSTIFLTQPGL